MKVKDIISIFSYGQAFEIRGAYSGKTYHKSYVNSKKNLEKYFDRDVTDTPIYSDMSGHKESDMTEGLMTTGLDIFLENKSTALNLGSFIIFR